MATNPMQRKARISFLLGMLLMIIILGAVIAFLVMQMMNMKKEQEEELAAMVQVYTLNQSVTSGQVITTDMFTLQTVNRSTVPANATSDLTVFQTYSLQDESGNAVTTRYENDQAQLYITIDGEEYELIQDNSRYYIERDNNREYITLTEVPLVAKVDMQANTVITTDLITTSDDIVQNDTRRQEYNMFVLPTDLQTGDYVDIRLMLPSGVDYIVVSKKEVEIPIIGGMDSTDTIFLNLDEEEILTVSNAIVDAYRANGSKLYVTKYTDPGLQTAATETYPPNREVMELIDSNPNILEEAKQALYNRYNTAQRNDVISPAVSGEGSDANVESGMEESIQNSLTTRQEYLQGLTTVTTTTTN